MNVQSLSDSTEASRAGAAARVLGDVLTAHYKEGSSWATLVEVKVETALLGQQLTSSASTGYVVAIVLAILAGLVIVAALLLLLLWRLRKRRSADGRVELGRCLPETVEKSNNLQNEENLHRQISQMSQMSQMKTLNVMELKRADALHKKFHDDADREELEDLTKASSSRPRSTDEAFVASSGGVVGDCGDLIESNPIYKAPCVDVRNTVVASNVASKDVNLKVLPLQRTSLRRGTDAPVKCQEVVV